MKSGGESWARGYARDSCLHPVDLQQEHAGSQRRQQDSSSAAAADANAATQPRNSAPSSLHDLPLRTSPLKPFRGAMDRSKVSLTPVPAHHNDDPSLHSFGNSFDMLSEADQFSFSDRGLSPAEGRRSRNRFYGIASPAGAFANQDLKPSPTDTTDNVSLSDISPIKLVYHSNGVLSEARRADDGSLERHAYNSAAATRANTFLAGPAAVSNPFYVLRCVQQAFQRCKYLLPCLREPAICPVNVSKTGPFCHFRGDAPPSPSSMEVRVAERRVETAVCAFGGYLDPLTRAPPQDESSASAATSIFRLRGDALKRRKYETGLSKRYTLSGSVVSWEFEEDPPVVVPSEVDSDGRRQGGRETRRRRSDGFVQDADTGSAASQADSEGNRQDDSSSKLKYRCKLCGKLKQNHVCPYRHSLHRSIGVMVYPAVNSFTASEPGTVAPPLSHMNNFVSYDSTHSVSSPALDVSPQATALPDGVPPPHHSHQFQHQLTVTPASIQTSAVTFHSPQSSLSHDHSEEGVHRHPTPSSTDHPPAGKLYRPKDPPSGNSDWTFGVANTPNHPRMAGLEGGGLENQQIQKTDRSVGRSMAIFHRPSQPHPAPIFVASVLLRPEHYRAVTPFKLSASGPNEPPDPANANAAAEDGYRYPVIPLTFAERKRLSDSLFYLSQGLPTATEDCARLLREARTAGEWDLAVAELLTQVVVGLYCGEGDTCLDGLQTYLLGLGVAC